MTAAVTASAPTMCSVQAEHFLHSRATRHNTGLSTKLAGEIRNKVFDTHTHARTREINFLFKIRIAERIF